MPSSSAASSLDLTGTLPTAAEVEAFLADSSANKRAEKIDELLETPAYAAWWTTKLCDFTGNNDTQAEQRLGPRHAISQEWYDWIYKRVERERALRQDRRGHRRWPPAASRARATPSTARR